MLIIIIIIIIALSFCCSALGNVTSVGGTFHLTVSLGWLKQRRVPLDHLKVYLVLRFNLKEVLYVLAKFAEESYMANCDFVNRASTSWHCGTCRWYCDS